MPLILIGYWRSEQRSDWPDPAGFVDPTMDPADRDEIADYLARGFVARAYLGESTCRLCGQRIGALELSDGVFVWPEGLSHYVSLHDVRLPDRFVGHVRQRTRQLEEGEVDATWWATVGPHG